MSKWVVGVVDKVLNAKIKVLRKIAAEDKHAVLLDESNGKTVCHYLNNGGTASALKDYLERKYIHIKFSDKA